MWFIFQPCNCRVSSKCSQMKVSFRIGSCNLSKPVKKHLSKCCQTAKISKTGTKREKLQEKIHFVQLQCFRRSRTWKLPHGCIIHLNVCWNRGWTRGFQGLFVTECWVSNGISFIKRSFWLESIKMQFWWFLGLNHFVLFFLFQYVWSSKLNKCSCIESWSVVVSWTHWAWLDGILFFVSKNVLGWNPVRQKIYFKTWFPGDRDV